MIIPHAQHMGKDIPTRMEGHGCDRLGQGRQY